MFVVVAVLLLLVLFVYYCIKMPILKRDIPSKGKAVLVTGAASGIGKSVCHKLLQEGSFVFACDMNLELLQEVYGSLSRECVCIIKMDVTCIEDIESSFDTVSQEIKKGNTEGYIHGSLFGLVNCAGVAPLTKTALVEKSDQEMEKMYAINVFGLARTTRVFYPLLRNEQNKHSSCVINIASVCGLIAFPFFSHYSPTKMAVIAYSDSLRRELMNEGRVRVTCICPGFTNTPIITSCGDKGLEESKFKKEILCLQTQHLDMLWDPKKMQQPDRVANMIVGSIFSTNNPTKIVIDHFLRRIQVSFLDDIFLTFTVVLFETIRAIFV